MSLRSDDCVMRAISRGNGCSVAFLESTNGKITIYSQDVEARLCHIEENITYQLTKEEAATQICWLRMALVVDSHERQGGGEILSQGLGDASAICLCRKRRVLWLEYIESHALW